VLVAARTSMFYALLWPEFYWLKPRQSN